MNELRISALRPGLPALGSKDIKATVTLIWPYSSSTCQFALLLAEPDFRLRRKNGQVRACFSGPSAKALASTGIGIGDDIILNLQGAEFVQEGAVDIPGKSIDWELLYTTTVIVQIFRNDSALADLAIVNVAPTPASQSPSRREAVADPSPVRQWSAPPFLKRIRLSEGPFFGDPHVISVHRGESSVRNRRRKRYGDRKAWAYSARTPSPEEYNDMEDDFNIDQVSPLSRSRATSMWDTLSSPQENAPLPAAAGLLNDLEDKEGRSFARAEGPALSRVGRAAEQKTAYDAKSESHEILHNADRNELDAGPDDLTPFDLQCADGGDTVVSKEMTEWSTEGEVFSNETKGNGISM